MSVKIVAKNLPAGIVPYEDVADAIVKQKMMLLNRNIASLAAQLAELQRAAIELQNRPMPKQKEIADIERYVAEAAASAESAATSATNAGDSAVLAGNAATRAGNSATAAGDSETNAENSATDASNAKEDAENARDLSVSAKDIAVSAKEDAVVAKNDAESAATTAASDTAFALRGEFAEQVQTATQKAQEAEASATRAEGAAQMAEWHVEVRVAHNSSLANYSHSSGSFIPLSSLVGNSSKTYDVTARFNYWYRYTPRITNGTKYFLVGEYGIDQTAGTHTEVKSAIDSITPSTTEPIVTGRMIEVTISDVSPHNCIAFVNGSTTNLNTSANHQGYGAAQWDVTLIVREHKEV